MASGPSHSYIYYCSFFLFVCLRRRQFLVPFIAWRMIFFLFVCFCCIGLFNSSVCSEHEDTYLKENQNNKCTYKSYLIKPRVSFWLRKYKGTLAGVAQWIECGAENQIITGSILCQGKCLGCRPGPQWGPRESQAHIGVSLPLFFSSFPSL